MTYPTLKDLTTRLTRQQAIESIYKVLEDAGFDTNLFIPGAPTTNFIMAGGLLLQSSSAQAAALASGSIIEIATGDYLARQSGGFFANEKRDATFAIGTMAVTGSNPALYQEKAPGTVVVTDGTVLFTNTTSIIVQSGTISTGTFLANGPGTAYNIPNNSTLTFVTTVDGATVTNGAIAGTSTWLTTTAVDEESDANLRLRNTLKWATLGSTTPAWVKAHIIASGTATTKVNVVTTPDRGPFTADIFVSADTTAVGSDEIDLLQGILTSSIVFGNSASNPYRVLEAPLIPLDLSGTVYFSKETTESQVTTQLENRLDQFLIDTPMGGYDRLPITDNVVMVEDIDSIITRTPGVISWARSYPASNISMPTSGVLTAGSGSWTGLSYTKLLNV